MVGLEPKSETPNRNFLTRKPTSQAIKMSNYTTVARTKEIPIGERLRGNLKRGAPVGDPLGNAYGETRMWEPL